VRVRLGFPTDIPGKVFGDCWSEVYRPDSLPDVQATTTPVVEYIAAMRLDKNIQHMQHTFEIETTMALKIVQSVWSK